MSQPFDIVFFGGSGDLALRKLIPAMYRSYCEGALPAGSRIFASCRDQQELDSYLQTASDALQLHLNSDELHHDKWLEFERFITPVLIDISQPGGGWQTLSSALAEDEQRVRVFYLAIPPAIYGVCCEQLSAAGLISEQSRIVVEKPIGYDRVSAEKINSQIARYFPEQSVYRIDHYLGKETVQNLMALRFSNMLFEQLWDAKSIDHVQISISETVGLEGRAGFYDGAGALRDMVQNHLLQLLCLVAMESPNKLNASSIRAEKLKVLEALRPMVGDDVAANTVRGQYVAGNIGGELVPGYLEELNSPTSNTETFVAMRAYIDNWRWARVPFYLRTGKRMKKRSAVIVIQFKDVSHRVYEDSAGPMAPNRLVIRLQPDEGIQLQLMAKNLEKLDMQLQPVSLNLNFSETYRGQKPFRSDAYKRLMLDAVAGNPSLFIHRDEIDSAWSWIDPIIDFWSGADGTEPQQPQLYRAGSWGPSEADDILRQDGREWFEETL